MTIRKDNIPFMTIKCPFCGNKLAYPFNEKSQKYCIKCGASIEDIQEYIEFGFKMFVFLLKYGLPVLLLIFLIDFLKNIF